MFTAFDSGRKADITNKTTWHNLLVLRSRKIVAACRRWETNHSLKRIYMTATLDKRSRRSYGNMSTDKGALQAVWHNHAFAPCCFKICWGNNKIEVFALYTHDGYIWVNKFYYIYRNEIKYRECHIFSFLTINTTKFVVSLAIAYFLTLQWWRTSSLEIFPFCPFYIDRCIVPAVR